MLFLQGHNLNVLLKSYCWHCCRQFAIKLHAFQNAVPAKKKWKADDIQTLLEWKKVTADVFGPLVKTKPIKAAKRLSYGSLQEKNKAGVEKLTKESGKICQSIDKQTDDSISTTGSIFVSHLKLKETGQATYDEEKSILDDSFLLEFTNICETKLVSASEHEMLESCVAVRGESRQPIASKDEAKKNRSRSSNAIQHMERKSLLSTPDETFDYQWVDIPPEMNLKPEIALSFKSKSQTVSSKSANEASVPIQNSMENVGKQALGISSDQSLSFCARTEEVSIDFECKNNLVESNIPLVLDRETFILSFPLIITDSNRRTDIVESKNSNRRMPSVTKILQATQSPESRQVLQKWEKQMIAELGEVGFAHYKADMFANGSNLHTNIELFLTDRRDEIKIRSGNEGHWQSIEPLLSDVTGVQYVEHPVRHPQLKYAGIVDCIAEYRRVPSIIEWKTSQRRKSSIKSTFDNPVQLAAYQGAYNSQMSSSVQVEQCVLVIGYGDGNAADVHVIKMKDCVQYWSAWLSRLNQYYKTINE